jgi:MMPL family
LTVLVFGAGTDYALLVIARYREELRRHADRHQAMTIAKQHQGAPLTGGAAGLPRMAEDPPVIGLTENVELDARGQASLQRRLFLRFTFSVCPQAVLQKPYHLA